MDAAALSDLLHRLITGGESEVVEFKRAGDGFSTPEIGKYFSALGNEANLRDTEWAWLVFGVDDKTRAVVGTDFRPEPERLHSVKQQVLDGTEPRVTFREVHELTHAGGRVLLFQIPPAPRGIPISWQGHFYGRAGESLGSLGLDKLDSLRNQGGGNDWSSVVVPRATLQDLDVDAVLQARAAFAVRHSGRLTADEVAGWSDTAFLERAGLSDGGGITRACLLLLGRRESAHLLTPLLAEITWRLTTEDRVYEHFTPPFLLATPAVYARIRNVRVRMLQPGTFIQTEVDRYERSSVLEALHNCIAHADYSTGARIIVEEAADRLTFINQGGFVDGAPADYVLGHRSPRRYRNPVLVNAMSQLNMIDHLGYGIQRMHHSQVRRFLPLPDYDLSTLGEVALTVHGAVIDENYSEQLMARTELTLSDVLALDRVQKGLPLPDDTVDRLRRASLVEGRRPHLRVAATIADATDTRAAYIRTRALDDRHYEQLVIDLLGQFGSATRTEIDQLLLSKLSDSLTDVQRTTKVSNLLAKMRRAGRIRNVGSRQQSRWVLL